jgi:hypothetical protein
VRCEILGNNCRDLSLKSLEGEVFNAHIYYSIIIFRVILKMNVYKYSEIL